MKYNTIPQPAVQLNIYNILQWVTIIYNILYSILYNILNTIL